MRLLYCESRRHFLPCYRYRYRYSFCSPLFDGVCSLGSSALIAMKMNSQNTDNKLTKQWLPVPLPLLYYLSNLWIPTYTSYSFVVLQCIRHDHQQRCPIPAALSRKARYQNWWSIVEHRRCRLPLLLLSIVTVCAVVVAVNVVDCYRRPRCCCCCCYSCCTVVIQYRYGSNETQSTCTKWVHEWPLPVPVPISPWLLPFHFEFVAMFKFVAN